MEGLTFEQLIGAAAVILILMGAYKTVMDVIKIRRDEKKLQNAPVASLSERIDKHDEMLHNDKRRIEKLEELQDRQNEELDALKDGMNVTMRSLLAMTRHMRHGNNVEGLDDADKDITNYLTDNRGRKHD